jgi:hypothetical protein
MVPAKTRVSSYRLAIRPRDRTTVKAAMSIRSHESLSRNVDAYYSACQEGDPEVVRIYFEDGYLNANVSLDGGA